MAYSLRAEFSGAANLNLSTYVPEVNTLRIPTVNSDNSGGSAPDMGPTDYKLDGAGKMYATLVNNLNIYEDIMSLEPVTPVTGDYFNELVLTLPAIASVPAYGSFTAVLNQRSNVDPLNAPYRTSLFMRFYFYKSNANTWVLRANMEDHSQTGMGGPSIDFEDWWEFFEVDLGPNAQTVTLRVQVVGRMWNYWLNGVKQADKGGVKDLVWTGAAVFDTGTSQMTLNFYNSEFIGDSPVRLDAYRVGPVTTPSNSSDFLLDTFTDPNGMFLDAHVGDSGVTWVKDEPLNTFKWVIQGNALQEADFDGGTGTTGRETHSTVNAPVTDYGVEMTLLFGSVTALVELSLSMRGYTIHDAFPERFNAVTAHITLDIPAFCSGGVSARENHPTGSVAGGSTGNITLSRSSGTHVVRLEVMSNVVSLYYDGTLLKSGTVTGFTAPGWAGFSIGAANMNGLGVVKIDKIRAYTIDPPGSFWTSRVKCTEVIGAAGTFMRVRRPPPPAPPPPRELEVYDLPGYGAPPPVIEPLAPADPNYPFDPVLHSTIVLDYFNDPAGTDITTHVGQAGTPWTIHPLFGQAPAPSQSLFRMTGISVRRTTYDEDYNYDGGNAMLLPAGRIAGNSKLSIYLRVNASLPYNATNAEVGVYHNTVLAYDPSNTDALFVFRTNAIFLASAGGTITIPLTLPGGDYHVLYESDGLNASVYLNGVLKGSVVRAVQIVDALSFYIFDGSSVGDVAIDTVHVYVPNLPGAFWTDRTRCTEVVS